MIGIGRERSTKEKEKLPIKSFHTKL